MDFNSKLKSTILLETKDQKKAAAQKIFWNGLYIRRGRDWHFIGVCVHADCKLSPPWILVQAFR